MLFSALFCTFKSSQPSCYLFAAVIAIDVFLKSFYHKFIIVSTHHRLHIASEMEFKQDSPNLNLDLDLLMSLCH